jgi:2-aminoadipate transaminase
LLSGHSARTARRAEAFARSPWTFIDQFIGLHPDLIYFGNGAPASELYPVERLRGAAAAGWNQMSADTLDYGELKGYKPLRQFIAERMGAQGFKIAAEDLLLTFGSQQGIDIASRLFLDPGDLVLTEGPTYIGALQAFDAYEPQYVQVPVDSEGIKLDLAEELVRTSRKTPKLIYVIPNFQNPTGVTMSLDRRHRLIELATQWDAVIVEDDPYGEFWYDTKPLPRLRQLCDRVLYLGTFSKTIAPGLRVGWMTLPPDLMGMALMAKESSEVNGVRDVTRTVHNAAMGFLDTHVEEGRNFYLTRRTAIMDALGEYMPPGVTWIEPGGGFFVWVTLPDGLTASELLPIAARHGVGFLPGRFFYPAADGEDQSLRLSFSVLPNDRIREGVSRLGAAIRTATDKK